jgi:hypothetical protein
MVGEAETQHRDVAEPEGEARDKADLGNLDGVDTPGRIDAVTHRAAGENAGADIVANRIGGEAGVRGHAIGHILAADRA